MEISLEQADWSLQAVAHAALITDQYGQHKFNEEAHIEASLLWATRDFPLAPIGLDATSSDFNYTAEAASEANGGPLQAN